MSPGIQISDPMAASRQQQAALNQLRISIAQGLHRELVRVSLTREPRVTIEEMRLKVAYEAVAQADALMQALGFAVRREEPTAG